MSKKKSNKPEPPSAPSLASLRMQMRLGKLSQAAANPEPVDDREPDGLFDDVPPATRGGESEYKP